MWKNAKEVVAWSEEILKEADGQIGFPPKGLVVLEHQLLLQVFLLFR